MRCSVTLRHTGAALAHEHSYSLALRQLGEQPDMGTAGVPAQADRSTAADLYGRAAGRLNSLEAQHARFFVLFSTTVVP